MFQQNKNKTLDKPLDNFDELSRFMRLIIWAALIAVGGWISIPTGGVPISMQTFFVVLAGLAEGPKRGAIACGLYLLAGFLGLPVFAGGVGGPAILFKPSVGFALSFPLSAAVAGLAGKASQTRLLSFSRCLLFSIAAHVLTYSLGIIGIIINTGITPVLAATSVLMFLPGDMAKCAAVASLGSSSLFKRLFK